MIGASFSTVLANAQAGRSDAFSELFLDVQPALLRYLRVVARERAEDVASETWVEIVKRLQRFEGDEAGFRAWTFTIARSKAVDATRRAIRTPSSPFDPEVHDVATSEDVTAQLVEEHMTTRSALALIATLPHDQAEAVVLRVIGGLDVAEVAAIMERSPGAVRVLSHRGLKKLAKLLSPAVEEEV